MRMAKVLTQMLPRLLCGIGALLTLLLGNEKKAVATITRDQKVFALALTLPNDVHTWRLSQTTTSHNARTSAWLDGV